MGSSPWGRFFHRLTCNKLLNRRVSRRRRPRSHLADWGPDNSWMGFSLNLFFGRGVAFGPQNAKKVFGHLGKSKWSQVCLVVTWIEAQQCTKKKPPFHPKTMGCRSIFKISKSIFLLKGFFIFWDSVVEVCAWETHELLTPGKPFGGLKLTSWTSQLVFHDFVVKLIHFLIPTAAGSS